MYGYPHTVSDFKLPIEKLVTVRPGRTYYVWFIFTDEKGTEITRRAVELCPQTEQLISVPVCRELLVTEADQVTIEAGDVRYVFSPKNGQLVSAELKGKQLIKDLYPAIWRKLNQGETSGFGKENLRKAVDLTHYTSSVTAWKVEKTPTNAVIRTTVDYRVDQENRFTVTYRYSIGVDGRLNVYYQILTKVAVPWLPIVGMSMQSVSGLDQVHWLGLGPYDAYPNKQAAPILGVWGGTAGSPDVTGIKAMRWMERSGSEGTIHVSNSGYMENDAMCPERTYILSGVFGRPEKGRRAEESVPQLRTDTGKPFVGEFSIMLKAVR